MKGSDQGMHACGVIVEYNPFHNGHEYHVQEAKKRTGADCIIAVMSGPFLQRGEPALIDPFHRAQAALASGVDIVVLLPFFYAVQSSALFSYGAVHTLHQLGVDSICFGSEEGAIDPFNHAYDLIEKDSSAYEAVLKKQLHDGHSFPRASAKAFSSLQTDTDVIDLKQPNNILGFSYVRAVQSSHLPITMETIKRKQSHYHEEALTTPIASATSIRKQLLQEEADDESIHQSVPKITERLLRHYQHTFGRWHEWEAYFPYIQYRVLSMSLEQLAAIYTVEEGIEHRIKETALSATSFDQWMKLMKTKRYTWSRLQRMFVFILVHVTKQDVHEFTEEQPIPYVHLVGMTEQGRTYLRSVKKDLGVPIITSFTREQHSLAALEERAMQAYYSILSPQNMSKARQQAFSPPIYVREST